MAADFSFHNHIRRYREALNLTQSDLAVKVGVSKNAISSFEREEYFPSAMTALFLCSALGCSFADLFYFDHCRRWPMMRDMALACIGCPFYDPDYGCLNVRYDSCPQYVPPKEVH